MDFIASMLQEQAPQLISGLTEKAGLSPAEAERFVPEAAQATVAELQKSEGLNLGELLEGGNVGSLLGKLNVSALASKVGIGEAKATGALQSFVPDLLGLLKSKGGGAAGLLSLLGGQGATGALPDAGEMGKKLFGN